MGLPQSLVLDLSAFEPRPESIGCLGFYCWHDYSSNPKLLQVKVSCDGKKYFEIGLFEAELVFIIMKEGRLLIL